MRILRATTVAAATAGMLLAAVLAGCGSSSTSSGKNQQAARTASLPLATSQSSTSGASFAVTHHNNAWELFVRPAGTGSWKLSTPPGQPSNGGLVIASRGGVVVASRGTSAFSGAHPSQQHNASPLSATSDQGSSWSQSRLITPPLASTPSALAAGPDGRLLAITDTGTVREGSQLGAAWSSVTSKDSLANSSEGKACGLTSLTSAAFSPSGAPMVGGACGKPGTAGIFEFDNAAWTAAGPAVPDALKSSDISVLGLGTTGDRTTALLVAVSGSSETIVAAWRTGSGSWTVSSPLRIGTSAVDSLSLWPDGAVGLVLNSSRGDSISGPGGSWQQLAALPAGTATLALGDKGQIEALASSGATLLTWQLGTGSGVTPASANIRNAAWRQVQAIQVPASSPSMSPSASPS
jgi:hypothetical protein